MINTEKGSPFQKMFRDYYLIAKLMINGMENGRPEEYWSKLIDLADQFTKTYPGKWPKQLIMSFMEECERQAKKEEKK